MTPLFLSFLANDFGVEMEIKMLTYMYWIASFIKIIHITTKFGEINLTSFASSRFRRNRASDRSTTRHRAVGAAAPPAAPPLLRRRCCWSTPHPRLIRSSASRHTAAAAGAAAARSGADRPHQPSLRAATWSSGAGTAVRTGRHLSCAAAAFLLAVAAGASPSCQASLHRRAAVGTPLLPALPCSRHRSPSTAVRCRPPPRAPALPPGSSAAGLFPTVASLSLCFSPHLTISLF
ncbi:hypothetical protein Scep_020008 [Stephania cephalantha]|uniref:Uncharacterized protein n=1 Tax=Stephania cephalantha TaxID=152367 RepID=A0AAP0IBT0_9MAGN